MTIITLKEISNIACGQSALQRGLESEGIKTTQATIWRKINQKHFVPAEWVLPIEKLYGVSRHDLRPDIYPLENERGSRDAQ